MLRLFVICIIIFFCLSEDGKTKGSNPYFPLAIGDQWVYVDSVIKYRDHEIVTQEILGDTLINNLTYYISKSQGRKTFYRTTTKVVYEKPSATAAEIIIVPSPDSIGKPISFERDTFNGLTQLLSTDTTFESPAQTYDHVICVSVQSFVPAEVYYCFYKKNVGLIGVTTDKKNWMRYLKSYKIRQPD